MEIILASASPRRKELLGHIFDNFRIVVTDIDESFTLISPEENVMKIATNKVNAIDSSFETLIIGADTTVFLDGVYYNKPINEADAARMLAELSGKTHKVYTGICIKYRNKLYSFFEVSNVTFNNLSYNDIDRYITIKQPLDKAGAYGIQDNAVVASYTGDYNNIMGLPVDRLAREIKEIIGYGN